MNNKLNFLIILPGHSDNLGPFDDLEFVAVCPLNARVLVLERVVGGCHGTEL